MEMKLLDAIPEYIFESLGFFAGISASFVIVIQIIKEYRFKQASSLSSGYILGWGAIFFCWVIYGIRFHTIALWLTNSMAIVLQILLYIVVSKKKKLSKK